MKKTIQELKNQLAILEKEFEQQAESEYRARLHRPFLPGDWVTDGKNIGVVGWTTNKACNIEEADGYMGVYLKNGRQGFIAPVKRDEWNLLDEGVKEFFTTPIDINITLTGADIARAVNELYQNHGSPLDAFRANLVNLLRQTEAITGCKIIF